MSSLIADDLAAGADSPLDLVEELAAANDWLFERGEDELTAGIGGSHCEYQMRFFWREQERVLQVACVFDGRVPPTRKAAVYETLALMNERLWLGHFEVWSEECLVLYRYAAIADLRSGGPSGDQIATIAETALSACERFYPVLQYVIWGGKGPGEAIEAAMLDTVGEA